MTDDLHHRRKALQNRLRALQERYSTAELSRRLGVARGTILGLASGEQEPRRFIVERLETTIERIPE